MVLTLELVQRTVSDFYINMHKRHAHNDTHTSRAIFSQSQLHVTLLTSMIANSPLSVMVADGG